MFMLPMSSSPVPFRSHLNGRQVNGQFEPGRFRFLAAGDSLSTAWNQSMESILIAIHPAVLHRTLGDDLQCVSNELTSNILPHDDPVLANLILALQAYIQSGCLAGRLFEQSILTAIGAHLLSAYGGRRGRRSQGYRAPLLRWKLTRVEEYVRQNLARSDLNLGEIAAAVNLSMCQLSRTFRATTGQRLWQFVLERRAREAMRMMSGKHPPPLAQIAHACGFESYSQFIAAFRKLYGLLPKDYLRTFDGPDRQ
ncbi:MAG: helix-turn-helix domain-containing protein [Gammaproteobacteria bacterium]